MELNQVFVPSLQDVHDCHESAIEKHQSTTNESVGRWGLGFKPLLRIQFLLGVQISIRNEIFNQKKL